MLGYGNGAGYVSSVNVIVESEDQITNSGLQGTGLTCSELTSTQSEQRIGHLFVHRLPFLDGQRLLEIG